MGRVADVLAKKGSQVFTIERTATVYDAVKKMVELNTGSLLVTQGEEICGIISERDYLRHIALEGRTSKSTQVREIMTPNVICVAPNHSLEECMAIMTAKRIRHLPVMEGGKLVGLVSIGDLVKQLSQDQQCHIQYLTDYITGKYPA
ncbi:MAG: CBS domain-containing protein [Candidatus Latescibacteria bacterium]|nr:CBS domain-containing protein [Candidatus Latescibacterota bacterium]